MRFLCRTDASLSIGTGHVVRCATLAAALRERGHEVHFLCRTDSGNLNQWLEAQGFPIGRLAGAANEAFSADADARSSRAAVEGERYDWLVVDHYGLDIGWERAMASVADRIFVIDDIGRAHDCDTLLDQNYANPIHDAYRAAAPRGCELLLGPQFALVRPEFCAMRPVSLARKRAKVARLLVFMGGSDPLNETTKALNGIRRAEISPLAVDVVIGGGNPHVEAVQAACAHLPNGSLHVQTSRMAELMTQADCAVCAGGSTTWERCVLGLPALVTILAENQSGAARSIDAAGGQQLLGWHDALTGEDYAAALSALDAAKLHRMSEVSAGICDGRGAGRVASSLAGEAGISRMKHG
jgi:UDP-2,4-diacetamido-2,4,6-trideoxy-beta-L-altropyranose hydrolase